MEDLTNDITLEHDTPSISMLIARSKRTLAVAGNPHRRFDPVVLKSMLARMEREGDTPVYDRLKHQEKLDREVREAMRLLEPMGTVIDDTNFGVAPDTCPGGC